MSLRCAHESRLLRPLLVAISSARPPSTTNSPSPSGMPRNTAGTSSTDHIYTDAAVSGASIEGRAGSSACSPRRPQKPRPFDVVLVDDSSRIARDIADAMRTMQPLKFLGCG